MSWVASEQESVEYFREFYFGNLCPIHRERLPYGSMLEIDKTIAVVVQNRIIDWLHANVTTVKHDEFDIMFPRYGENSIVACAWFKYRNDAILFKLRWAGTSE